MSDKPGPCGRGASARVTLACRLSLVPGIPCPFSLVRDGVGVSPPGTATPEIGRREAGLWGGRASQWERFSEEEGRVRSSPNPTHTSAGVPLRGRAGGGWAGVAGFMDRRLSRFPPSASAGKGGTGFGLPPYRNPAEWPKVCPPARLGEHLLLRGGVFPSARGGAEGKGDAH